MSKAKKAVVDLFAGAGGLSLGAARAGFHVAGAVEIDRHALVTHSKNFPSTTHLSTDVARLTGTRLLSACGLKLGELVGLIGGPPCQGFSSIGKKDSADTRNDLLGHFMRLVRETRPAFFIAENVPGLLHERNAATLKAALRKLPKDYVLLDPYKVEAFRYAAPTTRTRLLFIGYDPKRMRSLGTKELDEACVSERTTVREAFSGLPSRIRQTWLAEADGWRQVSKLPNGYFNDRAQGHIPPGVGDPVGLERFLKLKLVSGNLGTRHSPEVAERYKALKFGEMDQATRSVRLNPAGFCPTLRAGTGSDKGSFQAVRPIHPSIGRVITPREAARLQGFPDWFVLHPTKWHSFRQIGNSVSPLVAEAILEVISKHVKH